MTAYSTSKGGIIALHPCYGRRLFRYHIRVNAIVPGCMDTPMNALRLPDETRRQQRLAITAYGRLGTAEDVAGLAVFLTSDEVDFCVGGFYAVDGGMLAV